MLEKFKEVLDKGDSVSAIFIVLSKAFDTLNHDLLIAKREAYGFSAKSFCYMHSYLNKQLQNTIFNCDFSLWKGDFLGDFTKIYSWFNFIQCIYKLHFLLC